MFQKKTQETQCQNKNRKYFVLAFLAAAACLALTYTQSTPSQMNREQTQTQDSIQLMENKQAGEIQKLIEEGESNLVSTGAIMKKITLFGTIETALRYNFKTLKGNIKWFSDVINQVADEEILKQLSKPTAKLLGFDISNLIKDVELMAVTTKSNLSRSERKLQLREKYNKLGKLTARIEEKIWMYVVKSQIADLGLQADKMKELIKELNKIKMGSAQSQQPLVSEIKSLQAKMEKKADSKQNELNSYKKQLEKFNCSFLESMWRQTSSCKHAYQVRIHLQKAEDQIRSSFDSDRFNLASLMTEEKYFDQVIGLQQEHCKIGQYGNNCNMYGYESSKVVAKLESAQQQYEVYSNEKNDQTVDDELVMGSQVEDVNAFAKQLTQSIDDLESYCTSVAAALKAKKAKLTKILIWGN